MEKETIIRKTEQYVKARLEHDASGHDWSHIERVRRLGCWLAKQEGADLFIVEMAALLHDIADEKMAGSETNGMQAVQRWLWQLPLPTEESEHIVSAISTVSYKGGHGSPPQTLEAMVVQDADRLDALGAIGIARAFMYAGNRGHLLYDPALAVRETMTKEEYRHGRSTAIHHFYEKLLKLKDLLNTESAKKLAVDRHQFIEQFLRQFHREWNEASVD
ncbi:HD domain-containing protein [Anoxybacillus sp. J5B_2022]|uniref:HD domain-containing protein n=1 Tax=Anoxybacillus sp. J5B_2022 TaxID=3003246 RepID=UPI002285C7DC|nr:HD domain-containing protein [Anoxybacillus sp. J5B_2022]MCZ0755123.1 HD domain-containing protein [Anoxybacillus sp. J5B_2022]